MPHRTFPRIRALLSASLLSFAGVLFGLFVSANASAQRYVSVSTGSAHSCGVRESGQVFCWGENKSGQLGDGARIASTTPVRVKGLETVTAVSTGNAHSCAIYAGGKVACWGTGASGQLGHGAITSSLTPVDVVGISNAKSVGAGFQNTCALLADGSVRCWGDDDSGQLGNDVANVSSNTPVTVALGTNNATHLAVGGDGEFACVRRSTGGVACWGRNSLGQLGDGTGDASGNISRPTPVELPGVTSATTVSAGGRHACIALTSGAVQCWGYGALGQLGTNFNNSNVPRTVNGIANVTQLELGQAHTCARLSDATVSCWGSNGQLQLGRTSALSVTSTPAPVNGLTGVQSVAAGSDHSCALTLEGVVFCWGDGAVIGAGGVPRSYAPQTIPGITDATSVSVGSRSSLSNFEQFACARRVGGTVVCWGANQAGLGDGVSTKSAFPVPVSGITNAVEVGVGASHACARLSDFTVRCWGGITSGVLGNGTSGASPTPVQVTGLTDAVQITVGHSHTCARRNDGGSVVCWGSNFFGQLGDGTTTTRNTPVAVSGITNATDIVASGSNSQEQFSCARLATGSVACWGDNSLGQLGNGTNTDSLVPVFVSGLSTAASTNSLGAGDRFACARLTDGTLRCWGSNFSGRLGTGSSAQASSNTPLAVVGLTSAVSRPALGERHACATLGQAGGNVVLCWGSNSDGQIGQPSGISSTNSATPVFGIVNTNGSLSAGTETTCTIVLPGSVRCWGSNGNALLGVPAVMPTPLPTRIAGDFQCSLDIDGNGSVDALTDLLLLARIQMGMTGTTATANAIGANAARKNWNDVRAFLGTHCGISGLD